MSLMGYTSEQVKNMGESVGIAYELINEPNDLKEGLAEAYEFFMGLLAEGRV